MPVLEHPLPARYEAADDPVLGEGGMGRVLLVRDVVLDLPVALKIVRPDLAADARFKQLFDVEVRISARFTHPHIVPLHDHGLLPDGTPYLGLAFADAGSFAGLRDKPVPWAELKRLTIELLEALAHLHARGVLHRDLKPENVLLHTGADGLSHVWLADLGLANASSALMKRKGRMEGTPGFMAPEQRMGMPREYGPWTDLYSLGVMLWQLLTGARPFADHQTSADGPLPEFVPLKGVVVPPELALILRNLLDPEPLSRYDLASDLITELRALKAGGEAIADAERLTVATAAKSPSLAAVRPWREGSTMFRLSAGDVAKQSPPSRNDPNVPHWKRPLPPAMPEKVPPEPGFGAQARGSLQLFALRELPLVAREELRQAVWDEARGVVEGGKARVVVLVGEAGAGKSHLVESLCRTLEEGAFAESVHLSWQNPPGNEDGYAGAARALVRPWNESRGSLIGRLRRRLARERGLLDAAVREEANLLARWSGLATEDEEAVPAGLGLREVYRHLEARTWRGLSVLVMDDVHHALEDGDGLSIAESVLQRAQDGEKQRLLVLVTLRAEALARDPALVARVEALVESGARRMDVSRLSKEGTLDLVRECLTIDESLAIQLANRCEGNPLFARQLLLEWAGRGWLVDQGGLIFGLAEGVDLSTVIPEDAAALLTERTEGLAVASGSERRFRDGLHLATLCGMELPQELLAILVGPELEEFARGCGLWVQRGPQLRFDGTMLYEAVRDAVEARPDLAFLHRRVGRAFKRYSEATGVMVALDIGRHALMGRDLELALEASLQASKGAWARGRTRELDEAARLAVAAAVASGTTGAGLGEAYLWQGRSAQARGEVEEARAAYAAAVSALAALPTSGPRCEAQLGLGWAAAQTGKLDEAEGLYAEAMRAARAAGDREIETRAVLGKAWLEQQKRNFEGADILFQRVAHRCSQLGDKRGAAEATLGQAYVARRLGHFEDADELYEEAATALQEAEDLLGAVRASLGQAIVARQRGQLDDASAQFRDAMTVAEELGATETAMEARLGQAEIARVEGDLERSARLYETQVRWAERQRAFDATVLGRLGWAVLTLRSGDASGAYAHSEAAHQLLKGVPGHWLWATYRLVVAAMLAQRKDQDQTWRWLWSANELGLSDTVDADVAALLKEILVISVEQRWAQVIRLAGKLARAQYERLGDHAALQAVDGAVRAGLGAG